MPLGVGPSGVEYQDMRYTLYQDIRYTLPPRFAGSTGQREHRC